MAVEQFKFEKLATMDGERLKIAWEQEMKRAREDCKDRPAMKTPRKVTLTVELVPKPAEDGSLETVDVQFEVGATIPKRRSRPYNMMASQDGQGLLFNEMSPDEVRQGTLDGFGPQGAVGDAG